MAPVGDIRADLVVTWCTGGGAKLVTEVVVTGLATVVATVMVSVG